MCHTELSSVLPKLQFDSGHIKRQHVWSPVLPYDTDTHMHTHRELSVFSLCDMRKQSDCQTRSLCPHNCHIYTEEIVSLPSFVRLPGEELHLATVAD